MLLFLLLSTNLFALDFESLKIDRNWIVKYDKNEWSYLYLKPAKVISSHIFEHKILHFKLILQKESHLLEGNVRDMKKLTELKCSEANNYFSKKFSGKGSIELINNRSVCYLKYHNPQGGIVHQYILPEQIKKQNYEIQNYVWISADEKSKDVVVKFLKGFLK